MPYQSNWRRCSSCSQLFYNGSHDKGACPSGGSHDGSRSYDYCVPYDTSETLRAQEEWRHCGKCHTMFHNGVSVKGGCTFGGKHHADRFKFTPSHKFDPAGLAQSDWQYCGKCHSMFFNGDVNKGICKDGEAHRSLGEPFRLPYVLPTQLNFHWSPITLSNGDPVGGWAHLIIRSDGSYTWSGYFHDYGFTSYDVSIALGIKDIQNHLFGFYKSGRTASTEGVGSQHYSWNITENGQKDERIANRWAFLAAGNTWSASAHTGIHTGGIVEVIRNALGKITTVITVVSDFF